MRRQRDDRPTRVIFTWVAIAPSVPDNRPRALEALLGLYASPTLAKSKEESQTGDDAVTAIDYEEQGAGYQAGFSRLAASEGDKADLAAYVSDPQQYLIQELSTALQDSSKPIRQLLAKADPAKVNQLQIAGLRL